MRSGTIAFLAGILALQQFKELPELHWLALILPLMTAVVYFRYCCFKLILGGLAGFVWAWISAHWLLAQALPANIEGKNIVITGYIAAVPTYKHHLWQFEFDIKQASFEGQAVTLPEHVRLNWHGQVPKLSAGDQWRLIVRLKRPHGFMNPGGFDYEQWLFSHRIRATGYVRPDGDNTLLSSRVMDYPVQRLRQHLQGRLVSLLPDHPMQGVVSALILGIRDNISPQQWQLFRQTGTNHLVAISGLHIGLVAGLVFVLVRWGWARMGRLALRLAAPKAAAIAALMAASVYAALAGWSLPTQRAMIMVAVALLAVLYKRHIQPSYGLAVALGLVLLHDPLAVLSPGFWLSFGAVGLIFLGMQGRRNGVPWWDKWFRVQWIVGLGLLPLLLLFFQQSSLVSPLANFVAVPVVSLLVVPLLLIGILLSGIFLPVGRGLLELGAGLLDYLTDLLAFLGQPGFATWTGIVPDIPALAFSVLGIVFLLFVPLGRGRWLGIIFLLPLLFQKQDVPADGEIYFTLLDVGQGLAAVVQTRNHTLVFDTGPRFSPEFDTGAAVLIPFLRSRQIQRLDTLVVSHGDNDHIGGADSLLAAIPVGQVYTSAQPLLDDNRAIACRQGQHWQWDGVQFNVLHPGAGDLQMKENNQSCVLAVAGRYGSVLLPGDIEQEAERRLIEKYPGKLKSTILVAPHHGSKTSSSQAFIDAVKPDYVFFPTGYRNRFHFPNHNIVLRYQQAGIGLYDTAHEGAISFKLAEDPQSIGPLFFRQSALRYWHHNSGY